MIVLRIGWGQSATGLRGGERDRVLTGDRWERGGSLLGMVSQRSLL